MADWDTGSVLAGSDGRVRCAWATRLEADADLLGYHDAEWGAPGAGDAAVLEALSLGIFQAGLNWLTVLHKREAFRRAFHDFDPGRVAAMGPDEVAALFENAAIIRNRAKIEATLHNAAVMTASTRPLADIAAEYAPADAPRPTHGGHVAPHTAESEALSRRLKAEGYSFIGPTSTYSLMQTIGIVNDHIVGCFRGDELAAARDRS
ncbi:DNA-3-methyladenine glycosylase I [Leifsonia sp. NPDC058248]|uniref:DNA-3-methyladenine glycosylase I n=1 Tax=Leifsonia sp. NPDC058248 TaxID=3346402 RepID=UPI0036D937CA